MMNYEILFIVRPDLEEKAVKSVAKDLEKVLVDKKAKILSSKEMGQKELAYEIKNQKSGYYFLINVEANNEAINEFDRVALINESVIRHLITKLEK